MDKQPRYRATNLETVMEQQGRRGVWLAEQLGISRSRMTHIAKGRRMIDETRAKQAAKLLGVPFSLLFELSDDSETPSIVGEAA